LRPDRRGATSHCSCGAARQPGADADKLVPAQHGSGRNPLPDLPWLTALNRTGLVALNVGLAIEVALAFIDTVARTVYHEVVRCTMNSKRPIHKTSDTVDLKMRVSHSKCGRRADVPRSRLMRIACRR
jgi:hypothetical protein